MAILKRPVFDMRQQQQMTFAKIISEEGETEEERQNIITKVVHNHQFVKAAQMVAEKKDRGEGNRIR